MDTMKIGGDSGRSTMVRDQRGRCLSGDGDDAKADGYVALEQPMTYSIGAVIVSGAKSVVREGECSSTGRKLAIKVVHLSERHRHALRHARNELRILRRLRHEVTSPHTHTHTDEHALPANHLPTQNIVRPLSFTLTDTRVTMVMDLAETDLCNHVIEKGRLQDREATIIAKQIASAVAYLHDVGVCHRDIKPENVLYTPSAKKAVLADFELSTDLIAFMCAKRGTPEYVAPEILVPEHVVYTVAVDVWSMGATFYTMLSSHVPFSGEDPFAIARSIVNDPLIFDPPHVWESVPRHAMAFIERCMMKDPAQRLTAREALGDRWIADLPVPEEQQ